MPSVMQAAGGCGCSTGCASPTINGVVQGCNGLAVSGLTVEAHDATAGGTLLGSTTTDGAGRYSLAGLAGAILGNAIVLRFAKGARFTPWTASLAYTAGAPGSNQWSCGATTTRGFPEDASLHVAAGYRCLNTTCAEPLKNTLLATFTGPAGVQTMTFSGTQWQASFVVAGHTYGITFGLNPGGGGNSVVTGGSCGSTPAFVSCPPSFLQTIGLSNSPCTTDLGTSVSITE